MIGANGAWAQPKDLVRADAGVTKRAALVIGNTTYAYKPLKNPENDARAMARILEKLGFVVTLKTNLDLAQTQEAVNAWGDKLDGKTLALVYYSGHGIAYEGRNYLVPVNNAGITRKRDVPLNAYPMQGLLDAVKEAGCPLRIFILDACRNDPLPRGLRGDDGQSGLAKVNATTGTFIAYAARFGETASDNGDGKNGLYTLALLRYIETPGLPIERLFKRVRGEVQQQSQDEQHPDETNELLGEFCFAGTLNENDPVKPVKPVAVVEHKGRGDEYYAAKKYDLAVSEYSQFLDTEPQNVEVLMNRGRCYLLMKRWEPAINDCSAVLRIKPDDARAYNNRGIAYGNLKEFAKVVADCTEAIRLKPDLIAAYLNRADAYHDLGENTKAIADFTEAIRLKPGDRQTLASRGSLYYAIKNYPKAIADFTEAIGILRDNAGLYIRRGACYFELEEYDKAEADFTEWIRLDPKEPLGYYNRGGAHLKQGNRAKALADFRKCLELKPDADNAAQVRDLIARLEKAK